MIKLIPSDVKGKIVMFLDSAKGGWEHHYEIIGFKNDVNMTKSAVTRNAEVVTQIWHKKFPDKVFKTFTELNIAIENYNNKNKKD